MNKVLRLSGILQGVNFFIVAVVFAIAKPCQFWVEMVSKVSMFDKVCSVSDVKPDCCHGHFVWKKVVISN